MAGPRDRPAADADDDAASPDASDASPAKPIDDAGDAAAVDAKDPAPGDRARDEDADAGADADAHAHSDTDVEPPHLETPEETAALVPPPATEEEAEERRAQDEAIHGSPPDMQEFLEQARNALLAEGFYSTPMQYRKKDQVFGVIKEHGHDLQIHVRAFSNGVIESEVELSNRYIQHLWSPRRSAHAEITKIFEKHGVMTQTINTEFRTRTGADREDMPRFYTKTADVVKGAVGIAGAVGAVAIARYIQRRSAPPKKGGLFRR